MEKINKYGDFSNLEVTDRDTRSWMSDKIFKRENIKNFGDILKSVYQPIGHWKKKPGGTWGVMDLPWDGQRWSILNKINTNYSAFTIILNMSNEIIKGSKIEPFDLVNSEFGSEEWYKEYNIFIKFLKRNGKNIFLKVSDDGGSSIINKVVEKISWSSSKGDEAEIVTKKFLPKLNPGIRNIKIPDGYGDLNDMVKGVDIYFDYNDSKFSIQVKKMMGIIDLGDRGFKTKGASISKHYSTDYYSLLDNNWIYFFRNKNMKLIDGELIIPQDSFIKRFDIRK